ncbi:poly(A) polymerase gamma-like [Pangshura tecta]
MKIEATHVKKKQLHYYLPAEILQKRKKQSIPDIGRNISGLPANRASVDVSSLDGSTTTDRGTRYSSPSLLNRISKLDDNSLRETERKTVLQRTNAATNREKPLNVTMPSVPVKGLSIPVVDSKIEIAGATKAVLPPTGCTIPTVIGRNVIPRLITPPSAQGQQLLNGISTINSKNAAPKRPHSPSSEECTKRLKDIEKVKTHFNMESKGERVGEMCIDKLQKTLQDSRGGGESMPIPTIDTSRSQRLASKELPDSSSPVPTNNIRVIKHSIRLTLNR